MTVPNHPQNSDRQPGDSAPSGLVEIRRGTIAGVPALVVDARELHAFLQSDRQFADWIKDRIAKYGFLENQDFALVSQNCEIKGRGGDRRSRDYHLTLDTAKELSMVENNEQGRKARRYFIDMEKRALASVGIVIDTATEATDRALDGPDWDDDEPLIFIEDGRVLTTTMAIQLHLQLPHNLIVHRISKLKASVPQGWFDRHFQVLNHHLDVGFGRQYRMRAYALDREAFEFLAEDLQGPSLSRMALRYLKMFDEQSSALANRQSRASEGVTQVNAMEFMDLDRLKFNDCTWLHLYATFNQDREKAEIIWALLRLGALETPISLNRQHWQSLMNRSMIGANINKVIRRMCESDILISHQDKTHFGYLIYTRHKPIRVMINRTKLRERLDAMKTQASCSPQDTEDFLKVQDEVHFQDALRQRLDLLDNPNIQEEALELRNEIARQKGSNRLPTAARKDHDV